MSLYTHNHKMGARQIGLVILLWAIVWQGPAIAAIVHVDQNAGGANNGESWPNAYTNLQSALAAAGVCDEVWVAQGVYKPGVLRTDSFQLRQGVAIYGGFAGTEILRSQRNWTNHVATLSGDIGIPADSSDNSYHVTVGFNQAVLDGFTVAGGSGGTNWPATSGAGLFNSNSSPTIVNCHFIENAAYYAAGNGGAIFNWNSSPIISNCTFTGNSAYWGGAICNLNGGTTTVVNCEFEGNAGDYGGAINTEDATLIARDCIFIGNNGDGGGANNRGATVSLVNCVFAENNAGLWQAGGLRNVASAVAVQNSLFAENYASEGNGAAAYSLRGSVQFINCTFYGNVAELGRGGAIFNDNTVSASIKNGILWSNEAGVAGSELFNTNCTPSVSCSDIQGGLNGAKCGGATSMDGGGNLAVWPFFVNISDLDGQDNRFATADDGLQLNALLLGLSPCIDVALTNGAPGYDLVNLSRPKQYGVDMGAYEYNPDYDSDGIDNLLEYRLGSNANAIDSDLDGVRDGEEYYTWGSSIVMTDTDRDGMPDFWEIAHGLNPFSDDSGGDRDLDWLTNLQEFLATSSPTNADSNSDGTNDYAAATGKSGARYIYDRIDRLTGAEYERGFSIAYAYDSNGNILRQIYLQRDEDGDGLPDLWEFQTGLSWTNGQGSQGSAGDADGDEWSNIQEWQGLGNPTDPANKPDVFGSAPETAGVFHAEFEAARFTTTAGQLDRDGADEIIVGADGNPGVATNFLMVLSPAFSGWTTQYISVGAVGVTSIAVGQPTNVASSSIYVGTRRTGGAGAVLRISAVGNVWTNETIAISTNDSAFVLGVRPGKDVLVSLARTNAEPMVLTSLALSTNGSWQMATTDTNVSVRGVSTIGFASATNLISGGLRLLDSGGIQLALSNSAPTSIAEPSATNRILWSGRSLASGSVRSNSGASVFYQYVEDVNSNSLIDEDDVVVLNETEINGTNIYSRTYQRTEFDAMPRIGAYSLACVDFTNGARRILFTAEPDGGVYSWKAMTSTGALVRQVFSLHQQGTAWHDLAEYQPLESGKGMVGLNVETSCPAVCRVLTWLPANNLWSPAAIPQSAPVTRLLPDPNRGAGLSLVKVKIWDAEGNPSLPMLQYQTSGSSNWIDATILSLDGGAYSYSMTVSAAPAGSIHSFVWNSGYDVGVDYTNNMLLRVRSVDTTLWGEWSAPIMYRIEGSTDSDHDGLPDAWEMDHNLDPLGTDGDNGAHGNADSDDMDNLSEYLADTDPRNSQSFLEITGVRLLPQGLRVDWKGGQMARQYIQVREHLASTGEVWSSIYTNAILPTPITNSIIDVGATNTKVFYRIKTER